MYCSNCGVEIDERAVACLSCGFNPKMKGKFCTNCGNSVNEEAVVCIKCGLSLVQNRDFYVVADPDSKDWLTTLLLSIFMGAFGLHRFYTGHTAIGIIQLFTMGGCGIWALIDVITIVAGSYTDSNGKQLVKK